ncbi:hypothetical protein TIFTF001_002800 [Ficus carica]|uniref:Uncharacterized protein n=1 Tax=Ficus carica TaxID=3494 RepID=A0AA87Z9H6_FICCA|nr:hypothetical protein TIFTF001_002800 [Ficus carica]
MDKARSKRPLEENVDIPANIDLEENDAEEDELASVIRHLREEHERL